MRRYGWLLVLGLLVRPAGAQEAPQIQIPLRATWVGPLDLVDAGRGGRLQLPTRVELRIAPNGQVEGAWRVQSDRNPATGTIRGQLREDGTALTLDVTFDADATVAGRRCEGTARFAGTVSAYRVLRLTASRVRFAPGASCEDVTKLTWWLQVHQA